MSDNKPKPIPRKTPGGQADGDKKKGGMTMREQIAARKKAEVEAQSKGASAKPAPQAAAKSKGTPAKGADKPAAKATPKAPAAAPKAAAGGSSRPSARTAGAARGRGAKGDEGGDDSGGTTRGRRPRPEKKKKSPIPIIAAGVIVLGGAGAYFGGVFDGDKASAAEPAGAGEETTMAGVGAESASADAGAADMGGETTPTSEEGAAAADGGEATEGAAPAGSDGAAEAKPKAKAKADEGSSEEEQSKARTDLSGLKPFGKPPEATDEQWAELQEQAAEAFDPFSGAAGGRAKKKLIEAGKVAWPAILNEMIKLDPDKPDDNRMGFSVADALDRARGSDTGRAFDWRHAQDSSTGEMKAKDLYFNKRLIIMLHEAWAMTLEDPEHWAKYDKTDVAEEAAAKAKEKAAEALKESSDEFDDLDLSDIVID